MTELLVFQHVTSTCPPGRIDHGGLLKFLDLWLINHWFPLIRPAIKPSFRFRGGTSVTGGVLLVEVTLFLVKKTIYRYLEDGLPGFVSSYDHPHMGVSKNRGTPKWMVYNGKPY